MQSLQADFILFTYHACLYSSLIFGGGTKIKMKNFEEIWIFGDGFNRKTGGPSSLIDIANALYKSNCKIRFYVPFGACEQFINRPTNGAKISKFLKFLDVERYTHNSSKFFSFKHRVLNKFASLFAQKIKLSKRKVIVLDSIGLSKELIRQMKQQGYKLIRIHNGSCDTFIKYKYKSNDGDKVYTDVMSLYDKLLFQSKKQLEEYNLKYFSKVNATGILVIPSVEESELTKKISTKLFHNNLLNIVYIASIQERKNQHFVKRLSLMLEESKCNHQFHLVGPFVNRKYFEQFFSRSLESITFYGYRKDYIAFIQQADIIIHLAQHEGIPRALREAAFLGKPIVAFDVDGISDIVLDNQNGFLCQFGDLKTFSRNINKLNNYELRSKLGNNSKAIYEKIMSEKHYADRLISKIT